MFNVSADGNQLETAAELKQAWSGMTFAFILGALTITISSPALAKPLAHSKP